MRESINDLTQRLASTSIRGRLCRHQAEPRLNVDTIASSMSNIYMALYLRSMFALPACSLRRGWHGRAYRRILWTGTITAGSVGRVQYAAVTESISHRLRSGRGSHSAAPVWPCNFHSGSGCRRAVIAGFLLCSSFIPFPLSLGPLLRL